MIYIDSLWCKGVQETIFGKLEAFIPISHIDMKDKMLFDKFLELNFFLLDAQVFYLEKEEASQNFLIEFFKKYCPKTITNDMLVTDINDMTAKAAEYIKKNANKNLTIKDISDYLKVSQFHFIRLFKQDSHITPHRQKTFIKRQEYIRSSL